MLASEAGYILKEEQFIINETFTEAELKDTLKSYNCTIEELTDYLITKSNILKNM